MPRSPGAFEYAATLWTDSRTNEIVLVRLRGRSTGPERATLNPKEER